LSVHIPMKQFDSLNVAMAGSIALFELQKNAEMV
jgi:tRNA G18 (ribose-2'-O)-methylase SpoU